MVKKLLNLDIDTAQRMVACGISYTTSTSTQQDTGPSTVLDPPLHELLKYTCGESKELAKRVSASAEFKNMMYLECRRLRLNAMVVIYATLRLNIILIIGTPF